MKNYALNQPVDGTSEKVNTWSSIVRLAALLRGEKSTLVSAFFALLVNSGLTLLAPLIIAHTIDKYIIPRQYSGVLLYSGILLGMYTIALFTSYFQTKLMGGVGQRVLFNLRNAIFNKLQELPVAFFNQNKAGDLISRINNDTDKLNQFFSQALVQFVGSIFVMIGAGIFLVSINWRLGLATLVPASGILIFTRLISPWVKRKNAISLKTVGGMSAEIQESLNNFKVIVAFNRRDYFREKFDQINRENYGVAISAGLANNLFTPIYTLASNLAQLIVLAYGIYLITIGNFSLGLLISFLGYANNFYTPLRQLAALWANFQVALAGWDRISAILAMDSDMITLPEVPKTSDSLLEFKNVTFAYPEGKPVLRDINFSLERGKTYALVGPTGGGKTTTASLMARLYDPTSGEVLLDGRDIRSYSDGERVRKIGFILQEPFLFSGTVRENILYGNEEYQSFTNQQLEGVLGRANLSNLLERFDKGLETPIAAAGDTISLGQKQLIAFIRAVLRNPEILILDEATANIDTVTEQILDEILTKLPKETTRVIIAHRLNTIANADEIFFVNSGELTPAGSMQHAVDMLLHGKRES